MDTSTKPSGTEPRDSVSLARLVNESTEGTPVKSIHHGRVVFSDWLRGFGLLIMIDHGDGYLSLTRAIKAC